MEIKLINQRNPNLTITEQILVNRGIPHEKIAGFLNTTDDSIIDYAKLKNIEEAGKMLLSHYEKGSEILIPVDPDVDGITSASFLINYLRDNYLGIKISYQVRNDKSHGLELTEEILNGKYQLIIIPDAGSNQYDVHKQLKEKGIDIIVLDHHECEKESEDAIIVNNQLSEDYSNKALSGVGVVWQFCRCLDNTSPYTQQSFAKDYLDLVSLGLN